MDSITTVTQKGQVTIPVKLRKKFGLKPYDTVKVEAGKGYVKISAAEDILDMAGSVKAKKGMNSLKFREMMEKNYDRV